jgi:hypothetical protein
MIGTTVSHDAHQLIAMSHLRAGRTDETMATLGEVVDRFKTDPRRADTLMRLAQLTMQSRPPDRHQDA